MLGRALLRGAGFGVAMAAIEVWLTAWRLRALGMRPPLPMVAGGAAMLIGLATLIGGATVTAARRGALVHGVAMAIVWIAIQEYAAIAGWDGRTSALLPPLGGLVLVGLGASFGRRGVPVLVGMLVLAAGLVAPEVCARRPAPAAPVGPPAPARADAPDVVLIVLDTVRADHLGAYGYARPTSPRFDALAREGTLFLDAVAPATWSLPSHASLFTGRFVSAHGAHDEHPFLETGTPTLAERFAAAGYDTRAFTSNAWVTDARGMVRGFRSADEAWPGSDVARRFQSMDRLLDRLGLGATDKGGAQVATDVEQWLAARPTDGRPVFAFVGFVEAELPYHQLPPEYLARFTSRSRRELRAVSTELAMAELGSAPPGDPDTIEQATAMYDAGVAYADMLLGRVIDALRRRGTLDRTIVVVLADHGELLGEHGEFGHGRGLYEPVLHVPLLVRYPARMPAEARVVTPVSTVGVYATLLELAGLAPEPSAQVGSLTDVLDGKPHPGPIIAEQFAPLHGGAIDTDDPLLASGARSRAYRDGRRKLVDVEPGGTFFFTLDDDPREEHDESMRQRLSVAPLREELDAWSERVGIPDLRAPVGRPAPKPVDPERRRQLGDAE